uniref:Uncharacterized protein n=1 Tax=Physcomitrium patens TaxID=3218 RepID=A0A2K1KH10_PHYPA|nr:hypothetical protein PHYPA_009447 [Physcomitrium patens]
MRRCDEIFCVHGLQAWNNRRRGICVGTKLAHHCGFMAFFDNSAASIIWFSSCIFGWIHSGGITFWHMEHSYEDGETEDKFQSNHS